MKQEHIEAFEQRLSALGFSQLVQNGHIPAGPPPHFIMDMSVRAPQERISYTLFAGYDKKEGFTLHHYHATLLQYGKITHIKNSGTDTAALEAKLNSIRWDAIKYDYTSKQINAEDTHARWLTQYARQSIAELVQLQAGRPTEKKIAEQLAVKYLAGYPAANMLPGAGQFKEQYRVRHTFALSGDAPHPTATEAYNLLRGRPVSLPLAAGKGDAWFILEGRRAAAGEETGLKQYAAYHNYDVARVVEQLPLTIALNEDALQAVQQLLRKGDDIELQVYIGGRKSWLHITADPLNRSLVMTDMKTQKNVTMQQLGVSLTPPIAIDHYELLKGGEVIKTGNDYLVMQRYLYEYDKDITPSGQRAAVFVVTGVAKNVSNAPGTEGQPDILVMSANKLSGITLQVNQYVQPADIQTPDEGLQRGLWRQRPFTNDTEVEKALANIYAAQFGPEERASWSQKMVPAPKSQEQKKGPGRKHQHRIR